MRRLNLMRFISALRPFHNPMSLVLPPTRSKAGPALSQDLPNSGISQLLGSLAKAGPALLRVGRAAASVLGLTFVDPRTASAQDGQDVFQRYEKRISQAI